MKKLLFAAIIMMSLSSCLKESIADAMLEEENTAARGDSPAEATFSYTINGIDVSTTVSDPDSQYPLGYQLGCSKTEYPGTGSTVYMLDCVGQTGEFTFLFPTDSLTVGNYAYTNISGELFVLSYNNENEYVHYPTDNISFNVTSYEKGHISGTFTGALSPMVSSGYPNDIFGTPGSILITNGSFKDVPVFY